MSPLKKKHVKNVSASNASNIENVNFESAISNLETVINELERDDLSLDNALKLFQEGIFLIRKCDNHLKDARGEVIQLMRGEDGTFIEKILGTSLESFLSQESDHE